MDGIHKCKGESNNSASFEGRERINFKDPGLSRDCDYFISKKIVKKKLFWLLLFQSIYLLFRRSQLQMSLTVPKTMKALVLEEYGKPL